MGKPSPNSDVTIIIEHLFVIMKYQQQSLTKPKVKGVGWSTLPILSFGESPDDCHRGFVMSIRLTHGLRLHNSSCPARHIPLGLSVQPLSMAGQKPGDPQAGSALPQLNFQAVRLRLPH
ncbi:hypothetical protein D3C71_1562470 [compost metagenome]